MSRSPWLLLVPCLLAAPLALAEEGMWTYDNFPVEAVKQKYGFTPTQAWLDHARLSSVRLANGCSASFVSPDGLVMTNHHCIRECVQDLSSAKEDLLANGFVAATLQQERRCPKVEANQLVALTDVTAEVRRATEGKQGAVANEARKAEMTRQESACQGAAKDVRCEVVTLYNGGQYWLYKYRRFQDVRLAFAPEFSMAAFGGDPDNFNFPRYGFDAAFIRVWDGGKPLHVDTYFPWAKEGVKEGELVFVSGHPGSTARKVTVAELAFQRDVLLPFRLQYLAELRGVMREYVAGSAERFRTTRAPMRSVENALKGMRGRHETLASPAVMQQKAREEADFRQKVAADATLARESGPAFDEVAQALERWRAFFAPHALVEGGLAFQGELFGQARALVRVAAERPRPNAQRLREYTDARLPALEQQLLREAPVPLALEQKTLGYSLRRFQELLGADHPLVKQVLGREAPEDLAVRLIKGTRLTDAKVRRALYEGGQAAVDASRDPLIVLARQVDGEARALRKRFEDTVEAPLKKGQEALARARLAVYGTRGYPDATFSLRLNYGTVQGWVQDGRPVPAFTTFGGAYERNTGKYPFALPPRWLAARGKVPLETPFDMATTNDIIGGNSGSPMFNRDGRIVGLIFDGNLPSLGGDYVYVPEDNRAVAVNGQGLLAGLEHVYGARRLVQELRAAQK